MAADGTEEDAKETSVADGTEEAQKETAVAVGTEQAQKEVELADKLATSAGLAAPKKVDITVARIHLAATNVPFQVQVVDQYGDLLKIHS
ncbi:hypothetical protein M3225_28385 [Priestia aryabhattai]|uniref:hypothetical protein n=1 Tax=Priestia aryabhattai TaxID=412384 RepID=UPI00203FC56C|nr:hypothetical protein [Priestia aryabhattai]MCM3774297.1 hypothetical protein [Priestia aryabhattai]